MQIFLDGLNITRDGFSLAEQAFDGIAKVDIEGEVYEIMLKGLRKGADGKVSSRMFYLTKGEVLFRLIAEAVEIQYADRIREWCKMTVRLRSLNDMSGHHSNLMNEVA
jgi:hypothetical protein